jgi:hypothetical protein
VVKSSPTKFIYFCTLQKTTQSKQSPNRQKFAQSGHPDSKRRRRLARLHRYLWAFFCAENNDNTLCVVVVVSAIGIEARGFESSQGVRCLYLHRYIAKLMFSRLNFRYYCTDYAENINNKSCPGGHRLHLPRYVLEARGFESSQGVRYLYNAIHTVVFSILLHWLDIKMFAPKKFFFNLLFTYLSNPTFREFPTSMIQNL